MSVFRYVFALMAPAACSSPPQVTTYYINVASDAEVKEMADASSLEDVGTADDAAIPTHDAANEAADAGRDVAPPVDAHVTPPVDAGPPALTVRCGVLPHWNPEYTVTCTPTPTWSDPSVLYIEWETVVGGGYTACAGPCQLGSACRVHFVNGSTASAACN